MALNCSQRRIFPSHISEDNLVSPMRIAKGCVTEEIPEGGGESCVNPWQKCHEIEGCFDYVRRDNGDRSTSPDSSSSDIIDLLPSDPFGMDISTTFTAITGWLEDLEVDCGGYGIIDAGNNRDEYDLYAGLNFFWNNAVQFQAFPGGEKSDFTCEAKHKDVPQILEEKEAIQTASCGGDDGSPHQALFYSLNLLGVRDLLSVGQVCKSLHSTVESDPLLWRSIHIGRPLNEKICDDVLLQLTARAQGNLQSLILVDCQRITDDGLRAILDTNPKLSKLCVPGCTRLTIKAIASNLKFFNSKNKPGIKRLRIGGIHSTVEEHFEEVKLLFEEDSHILQKKRKPLFFHERNLHLLCEDDRAIDIETCPKCQKLRLVYDCPAQGCQETGNFYSCRACRLCTPRCHECGRCIINCEYEETFSLENRCVSCSKQLYDAQDCY